MCTTIITTRLPFRLANSFRIGIGRISRIESATKFASRYLTCCGTNNFRWHGETASPQNVHRNEFLNAECSSRLLFFKYGFSTKNSDIEKGIIPGVPIPKHHSISGNGKDKAEQSDDEVPKKLGLFARFKLMYKQYWYVLIPVHVITSVGWFAGFYYLSQSGVDIPAVLETLRVSETIIDKLKDSSMGHVAIAYLCYKIATPVRYMVTLGGTTISIKYLEQYGYIKPMPTRNELFQMYEDKKAERARRQQR